MSFAEPNMLNPQVFIMFKFRRWFPEISPDENALLQWKLKKTLQRIGFEQIKITPFDWLHPSTPERFIPITRQIGGWLEKTPGLRQLAGSLYIQANRPLTNRSKSE